MKDLPRSVRAAEAAGLRASGLLHREIADRMGISVSYAIELVSDPAGAVAVARKKGYGGVCGDCGGPTDGSNGRAKAPLYCAACTRKRREPQHGTKSRYNAGCSCDLCREANRLYSRSLVGRTPPTHGSSGYTNYGCRCPICREAHSVSQWMLADERKRYPSQQRRPA